MKIVYNSFAGRYSDNPRVIFEALRDRPGLHHVWLRDPLHAHGFPPDVQTVPVSGAECREALESADVVVSNTHVEIDWTKRAGATYLQTWHGTPLKHIHYDSLWAPPGRVDYLSEDVRRWDAMLSPNHASTMVLRGAFGFIGEVAETGYPRNDVLSSPQRDEIRDRVREALDIPAGSTAVLYTPTWRDDLLDEEGALDFRLHLDVEELTRRLGDDHVLLLRLHSMVTGRLAAMNNDAVRDVSFYPDVADLYLAADAMITDYSSTMFDFAVTGKPMIFFAYDLDDYRDRLRGFYYDFTAQAPGPLVQTSTAVVDALADLDEVRADYRDAYRRFRQTFCHLEDGQATQRVLDRFFPVTGEASGDRMAVAAR